MIPGHMVRFSLRDQLWNQTQIDCFAYKSKKYTNYDDTEAEVKFHPLAAA